jgi:glycosyltransferase involved in cell wall biosynthesis
MFDKNMFGGNQEIIIPPECNVVFVADLFAEDYAGGAELTTDAIIGAAPQDVNIFKLRSSQVTEKTVASGYQKYWIFGNFASLNPNLIPLIVKNVKYSVLEYDYKFCKYRSIEKHQHETGQECDCADTMHGKIISAFLHAAKTVYWMSNQQLERYTTNYPFLEDVDQGSRQIILSSVFAQKTFIQLDELATKYRENRNDTYIVLGSDSWIKGKEASIKYCEENNLKYEVVWDIPYDEVLDKLAQSAGLVYLPLGGDTCPRMVLEAQLLGIETIVNDNVQHAKEFPFTDGELVDVWDYLTGRAEHFWLNTIDDMDWYPRISGYTTTYNCISQQYPFTQSIMSMVPFCEEVVVMDGGSNDGTYEALLELAKIHPKICVFQHKVDWTKKRSAVEDGLQKARARARCTQKYCWQMDVDEIVHETYYNKIASLVRQFPSFVDLVSLPVIEYWGGYDKVRCDINPGKWRISRNKTYITHGIPKHLQLFDVDENMYAAPGTDGCDLIHKETNEPLQHASFYTQEMHELRVQALSGDDDALKNYAQGFNTLIENVPGVFHYSWFDLERKIKTYKGFWQNHWESLYNVEQEDTAENNMFFDKPWSEVSDDDIKSLAVNLKENMGGWIFHEKIDFSKPTPHITINIKPPGIMDEQPENTSNDM